MKHKPTVAWAVVCNDDEIHEVCSRESSAIIALKDTEERIRINRSYNPGCFPFRIVKLVKERKKVETAKQ